jgi:tetratricopeptide (TPR) repeat protein
MLYLNSRRNEEALAQVEEMAQQFPEKGEVLMMLLELYGQNSDYENMVKVLDKIELKEGKSEQLSMEKFRIFLQMQDEERAFSEMQALAEEYPNDLRYQVVVGDLYLDTGKKEEALEQYRMVEQKDSSNVTLLLSLSNYYQAEGNDSLYQIYLTKLMLHPAVDDITRVRMMGVVIRENLTKGGDSTMVMSLFDKILQEPQEHTELLELKVRYMISLNMSKEIIKPVLYQMLGIDPEDDTARQQLLSYAIEDNDTSAVVSICKPAVDYKAKSPVYYYYLGVVYFQLDRKEEAVGVLQEGIERVRNSDNNNKGDLYTNIYAMLGDIYHDLDQDDKAFQAYDSCLVYKQNDAMVLNNYAYYLSLNKKDLQRAEEMSRKSNEIEPDNPTYLDTYAWVLYQLKRYEEAKQYMDRVVELMDPKELEESQDVLQHIKKINKKVKKKK